MSVVFGPQPIPDFAGFVESLVTGKSYRRNPCSDHCPYQGDEHAHLSYPDGGGDFITWADGRYSGYDLSLPATLVYAPVPVRNGPRGRPRAEAPGLPPAGTVRIPGTCYRSDYGFPVHMRGCRCPR